MAMNVLVTDELIERENRNAKDGLDEDFEQLGRQLARRGIDIEGLVARVLAFRVAVPSWGVGTGGTRFARFPGSGEPRAVFEKLEDCATSSNWCARRQAFRCTSPGTRPTVRRSCEPMRGRADCTSTR